jgi:sugar/nucleoside kinase (ribokinase family)
MTKPFDITIAGELNLDLILYGLPVHMPLEVELLASGFRATLGSSSAIVAHNAASLGARVAFTSFVGTDDFGAIALRRLQAAGVDTTHIVKHSTIPTGITLLLPHGAERHILTYPGTISEMTVADLDLDFLTQARHFHLSSLYLQRGLHAGLPDLFHHLKRAGLTISMDTNDDPEDRWAGPLYDLLPYVDVFLPNESEIIRITGAADLHDAIVALSPKVPTIIVKRGARGALVHQADWSTEIPPIVVSPVDTIGAGDSFDAGFLWAFLQGKDMTTCARAGNLTGALSTQASGGTDAFVDERLRGSFLADHNFFDLLA